MNFKLLLLAFLLASCTIEQPIPESNPEELEPFISVQLLVDKQTVSPDVICDYSVAYKMPAEIRDLIIDGASMDTNAAFNFPYPLQGSDWTGADAYNFKPLELDLQNYIADGTAQVFVDPNDGALNVIVTGTNAVLGYLEIYTNNEVLQRVFIQDCP